MVSGHVENVNTVFNMTSGHPSLQPATLIVRLPALCKPSIKCSGFYARFLRARTAVGTGPAADPAAAGPISWQTRTFMFTLGYINIRERESILKKISKIGATRCQILTLKCTKFDFPLHGGAYSAPHTP